MLKAKESYSMWDGMDIRNNRDTLGMTQRALARALGISHRMLCYYEAGERDIPKSVELSMRYVMHNRKKEEEPSGTLESQGTLTAFDRERISHSTHASPHFQEPTGIRCLKLHRLTKI